MRHSFHATEKQSGIRVDVFLLQNLPGISRSAIQRWIESGLVSVQGQPTKPGYRLRAGDRIEVIEPEKDEARDAGLRPWKYPLHILYEDTNLIAIDKPPHLVVHPGAGRLQHTLANAIVEAFPELAAVGHPLRPGIVHRLDQETSGVLLIARNQETYLTMVSMFQNRRIEKHYRALAYGRFQHDFGKIEKGLGRDPRNRKKISIRAPKTRSALTLYTVLERYEFGSLLDVRILTGRTHQIRVHLSSDNHPIVGDTKYGGGDWNRIRNEALRAKWKEAAFFGLHAYSLDFQHPRHNKPVHIESPLPELWRVNV